MRCSHRAGKIARAPSLACGGSGLLARGGVPPAPPCTHATAHRRANAPRRWAPLYRWGRIPLRSIRPPGRSIPSAFESVSVVPAAASGAGSPEACRARPAAFRNPVQRAASGPAVAWLAGGPRGREVASPCGPRLRRAWAPAPQYAAWGAQTLQGMRKKCRTAGPAGRPGPLGRASRWPLGGFFARGPIRRHPLPPRLLVVVVGGSGFPPPAAGPAPRDCRGREGFARSRPVVPLGFLPARFFLSRPLQSRWRASFFPFALAGSCRSCSSCARSVAPFGAPMRCSHRAGKIARAPFSAWRPAVGGPRRPCGRQWYTEGAEDGENERRTERPRREALPPARGLVPCATSFAIDP